VRVTWKTENGRESVWAARVEPVGLVGAVDRGWLLQEIRFGRACYVETDPNQSLVALTFASETFLRDLVRDLAHEL
jgi:hypothetical protein